MKHQHILSSRLRRMYIGLILFGLLLAGAWAMLAMAFYHLEARDIKDKLQVEISHHLEASQKHISNHLRQVASLLQSLSDSHVLRSILATSTDPDANDDLTVFLGRLKLHINEFRLLDVSGMERVRLIPSSIGNGTLMPAKHLQSRRATVDFQTMRGMPDGTMHLTPLSTIAQAPTLRKMQLPVLRVMMPVYIDGKIGGFIVAFIDGRKSYWNHPASPLANLISVRRIDDAYVYRKQNGRIEIVPHAKDQKTTTAKAQPISISRSVNIRPANFLPLTPSQHTLRWQLTETLPAAVLISSLAQEKRESWLMMFAGVGFTTMLLSAVGFGRRQAIKTDVARMQLLRQVKSLSQRMMTLHEDEQQRLARWLHDDIAQTLTVVQLHLSMLARDCAADNCDATERIEQEENRIVEMMNDLRNQLRNMRPPQLEALGLRQTLIGLCDTWQQTGRLSFKVDICDNLEGLEDMIQIGLYRLLQEALTNIARHAEARHVQVSLVRTTGEILLHIADDGCGFNPLQTDEGLGLIGMNERIELLGGKLKLTSRADNGTSLDIRLPIDLNDNQEKTD
ncbi:MAG: sensor histidine kinase [Mariprofundaceae bacterium]|nr:sensor histidine kinase [Mariprofundaceae bacterium]